jgi:hypothetical protein
MHAINNSERSCIITSELRKYELIVKPRTWPKVSKTIFENSVGGFGGKISGWEAAK